MSEYLGTLEPLTMSMPWRIFFAVVLFVLIVIMCCVYFGLGDFIQSIRYTPRRIRKAKRQHRRMHRRNFIRLAIDLDRLAKAKRILYPNQHQTAKAESAHDNSTDPTTE